MKDMLRILVSVAFLMPVVYPKGISAKFNLPDIIIGDPNDASNDILGSPISAQEFEDSLKINVSDTTTDEDPITTSGFFQGDIMVDSPDQLYQILEGDDEGQNSAIRNPQKTWPNAVIPYVISATYSSQERAVIARAMSEYHQNTCIRFVPRTSHANYIHILRGQGCSSAVGRSGGSQVVSLGYGCVQFGVVLHELMHAAGFWHEQSRPDRDSYVTVNWSNIYSHLQYNFEKKTNGITQDLGLAYDYASIMHYGPYAFAINRNYPTLSPRQSGVTIGQRSGFSQSDIEGLKLLYNCAGTTGPTPAPPTPAPTTCVDKLTHCPYWARLGYCFSTNSYKYMAQNCKKSCNLCSSSSTCADKGTHCRDWASKGECQRNPGYMKVMCQQSCNLCGTSGSCTNQNRFCEDWAKKGECQRNTVYMNKSCAKACGLC